MELSEIKQKVEDVLTRVLGIDSEEVKDEAVITDDLGADSLDIVELILESEREFGVTITDDEAYAVRTVNDLIGLVNNMLNGPTA